MSNENSDIINRYFPDLNDLQKSQFAELGELYHNWNAQINVISRKDIDELYTRHVLHSLAIAQVQKFADGSDILDIGTGGGFPGIPLAILHPNSQFVLVDSIGKKIKVVNEVSKALGLTNVTGIHERAENINQSYDFIVSRAVTRMKPFYQWTKGKFKKQSLHEMKNGILYLKGGDLTNELKESKLRFKSFDIQEFFTDPFFETKKVVYVPHQ